MYKYKTETITSQFKKKENLISSFKLNMCGGCITYRYIFKYG